jgi:hypothetical protein
MCVRMQIHSLSFFSTSCIPSGGKGAPAVAAASFLRVFFFVHDEAEVVSHSLNVAVSQTC